MSARKGAVGLPCPKGLRPAADWITENNGWISALAYPAAYVDKAERAAKACGIRRSDLFGAIGWRSERRKRLAKTRTDSERIERAKRGAEGRLELRLPVAMLEALRVVAKRRGRTVEDVAVILICELLES